MANQPMETSRVRSYLKTKKLLVAFDPSNPNAESSDFLVPVVDEGSPQLIGVKGRKPADLGMMVYVGRDVTMNDLFAKLVETGRKIVSVDGTIKGIEAYLRMLQDHKIGNILSVKASSTEACGFQLEKVANSPGGAKSKLP